MILMFTPSSHLFVVLALYLGERILEDSRQADARREGKEKYF